MLNTFQKDLQEICETTKAITGIDITIVDKNLQRICGTGEFKEKIGGFIPQNSVYHKSLETGKNFFITDPTKDSLCQGCYAQGTCKEQAELCMPIVVDENIVGILGMSIFNHDIKGLFVDKKDDYEAFENRLSNLIASKIHERLLGSMAEYKLSEFNTLIDSIKNEGVITINNDGQIITVNKYLKEKYLDTLKNSSDITSLLSKSVIKSLKEINFNGEIGPLSIGKNYFIINSSPILVKDKREGAVLLFSDFNKMQKSVFKVTENPNITTFEDILGESEILLKAKLQAMQVAESDVSVLLLGESGTGKEVFARAIHCSSKRREDIFMPINCGAIPESLIESELFGYEKGSFTGGNLQGKLGKFEIAKNGTVFLDELGDLPQDSQVKLLRVLEEKEIMRVGGLKTIKVNPRIISATNKDLHKLVSEDIFREDLFYRINVIPIRIPPLRERSYDIILLARYFLKKFCTIYEKDIKGFTNECEKALLSYSFPGNIRELKNLIEYGVNFATGSNISLDVLGAKLKNGNIKTAESSMDLNHMVKDYQKALVLNALNIYGNDLNGKKAAAKALGISMATLYRIINGQ